MLFIPLFCYADLETITVRASSLNEDTPEVSPSVSILESQEIEQHHAATVAEILRALPGVDVVSQGSVGQVTSIFIRGARSEDTLVLIDGIVANDMMAPSGGYDFANLSPINIERIEVYRGPQTVRFGNGSLGGVINIITKQGQGPLQGRYFFEAGSYNTQHAALGLSGQKEQFGYSLAIDGLKTNGFSSADKHLGNTEDDGAEMFSASGKLAWTPEENSSVTGTVRYAQSESDRDNRGGVGGDDSNATGKFRQTTAGILGSQRFFDKKLRSTLSYSYSEVQRDDFNPPDPVHPDEASNSFLTESQKFETLHDFSVTSFQNLKLILSYSKASGTAVSTFNGTPTFFPRKEQINRGESLSYSLDDTQWIFDAGLRGDQQEDQDNAISTRVSGGRRFFGDKTTVRVTYGSGFKHPSLYQLYSSYGNLNLDSETSHTVDVSLEQNFTSRIKGSVDYFKNSYSNLIDFDNGTSKYMNVSSADSNGVEFQGQYEFNAQNGMRAVYTYLQTKEGDTGNRLLRRPQNSASLMAYSQIGKISALVQCRFVGERDDIDPATFARVKNPSYELVHLKAEYRILEDLRISMRLQNLFDRQYEEIYGYGTAGRSFYIGLSN